MEWGSKVEMCTFTVYSETCTCSYVCYTNFKTRCCFKSSLCFINYVINLNLYRLVDYSFIKKLYLYCICGLFVESGTRLTVVLSYI